MVVCICLLMGVQALQLFLLFSCGFPFSYGHQMFLLVSAVSKDSGGQEFVRFIVLRQYQQYIYIYIYYISLYIRIYIYICTHTYIYIFIYTYTQRYIYIYIYIYKYIYIYVYIYIYTYIYIYNIHRLAHIHAQEHPICILIQSQSVSWYIQSL